MINEKDSRLRLAAILDRGRSQIASTVYIDSIVLPARMRPFCSMPIRAKDTPHHSRLAGHLVPRATSVWNGRRAQNKDGAHVLFFFGAALIFSPCIAVPRGCCPGCGAPGWWGSPAAPGAIHPWHADVTSQVLPSDCLLHVTPVPRHQPLTSQATRDAICASCRAFFPRACAS